MIRQKRLPLQRVSLNHSLNINSGAFLENWAPVGRQSECQLPNNKPVSQVQAKRSGLVELSNNCSLSQAKEALNILAQSSCLLLQNHQHSSGRQKGKENLFGRIAELIKGEEVGMAPCNSNRSKEIVHHNKPRPYTSLSSRTRLSLDPTMNKCHVVLHLTPNEDVTQQRTSTSRALMNYSKVFRNVSDERFKVKKDRNLMPRVVQLSAQKIVFHEKERKQKKELPERPPSKPLTQRRKTAMKVERYQEEEEEFQIGGWDYFE